MSNSWLPQQETFVIPVLHLEHGAILQNAPIAYTCLGTLSPAADNVVVAQHALSGDAHVATWWHDLLGPGKAFDTSRFFVVCFNVLGSPYGSASPLTFIDGDPSLGAYGTDFPRTSIRDDVRAQRMVLEHLGVRSISSVVGGSMGGMVALEYAYLGSAFVRSVVVIAAPAKSSPWLRAFGEVQRRSIVSDARYAKGLYTMHDPPNAGLGIARLVSLLSCRTASSFQTKFEYAAQPKLERGVAIMSNSSADLNSGDQRCHAETLEGFLERQTTSFVSRFDANCYLAILDKLDTHDVARGRASNVEEALSQIDQPSLIVSINSDLLCPCAEQMDVANAIPNSTTAVIQSIYGHDAFLIETGQINSTLKHFWDHCGIEATEATT